MRALAVAVDAHGHVAIWVCLDRGGNTTIRGKYVMQWDYAGSFPVRIMIKGGKSIHNILMVCKVSVSVHVQYENVEYIFHLQSKV